MILELIVFLVILFSVITIPVVCICLLVIKISDILCDLEIKKWLPSILPGVYDK